MYIRTFNLLKGICAAQAEPPNYSREQSVASSLNSFDSSASSVGTIAEDKYFYTCLWSAIVSQSSVRFQAITFILENYEKKMRKSKPTLTDQKVAQSSDTPGDDQLYLIGSLRYSKNQITHD